MPSVKAGLLVRFIDAARVFAKDTVGEWLGRYMTPNQVTLAGTGITLAGCAVWAAQVWFAPAFWIGIGLGFLGTLGDWFDGAVARAYKMHSDYGEMLDSKTDRVVEGAMFIALSWVLVRQGHEFTGTIGTGFALLGSFMVSYSRAKAEIKGLKVENGMAPRFVRVVLVGAGVIAGRYWGGYWLAVYPVLALSWITVLQREIATRRLLEPRHWDSVLKEKHWPWLVATAILGIGLVALILSLPLDKP